MATSDFEKTALSPRSSGPWPTAGAGAARSASANATTVGTHTALARFAGRRDLFRKSGRPAEAVATSTGARNRAGLLPPPVAGFTELVNIGLAAKLFVSRGASTPGCTTGSWRGREEMTMRDTGDPQARGRWGGKVGALAVALVL